MAIFVLLDGLFALVAARKNIQPDWLLSLAIRISSVASAG